MMLATRTRWPGFDPQRIPLALFDGSRTLLFHSEHAPEGFTPLSTHPVVLTYEGRHPAITANTATELAGVLSAVVLATGEQRQGAERQDAWRACFGSGYRVEVVAETKPLRVVGFDPMNLRRLDARTVLHRRYLKLEHEQGTLELLGQTAFSEAANEQLLTNVRRVIVTGLTDTPELSAESGGVRLEAAGLTLAFAGARLERREERLVIHLV